MPTAATGKTRLPRNMEKKLCSFHIKGWKAHLYAVGLKIALGIFQHVMDVIFSTSQRHLALVYLDDLIIFLSSPYADGEKGRHASALLPNAGVTINLKSAGCLPIWSATWLKSPAQDNLPYHVIHSTRFATEIPLRTVGNYDSSCASASFPDD